MPLAPTANRHGRAIGQAVAGDPTEGGGVAGTAAVKAFEAFEVEAARTGITGILDHGGAREAGTVRVTLTADRASGRLLGGVSSPSTARGPSAGATPSSAP